MRNNVFDHWISIVIRVGGKLQVGYNYDLSTLNWSQLSKPVASGFFLTLSYTHVVDVVCKKKMSSLFYLILRVLDFTRSDIKEKHRLRGVKLCL
jgi:hypothetical protein